MGRPSKLANPEFAQQVAELYAAGVSHKEMADALGAHPDTITDWVRDVRVQSRISRLTQERVNRVLRIVDTKLLRYVDHADEEENAEMLLKIRKAFVDSLPKNVEKDDSASVGEVIGNLEENPELAQALQEMMGVKNVKK